MLKELCYVVDSNDQPLSPTNFNKWFKLEQTKYTKISEIFNRGKLIYSFRNGDDN